MVPCPDVVPFVDHRFDCCDLFQRSIIHYGAYKASAMIEDQACLPIPCRVPDLARASYSLGAFLSARRVLRSARLIKSYALVE